MPRKKKAKNVSRFKTHHKVVFSILATIGAVAVWRGIWVLFDSIPYFDQPIVAVTFAFIVLIVAGVYFKLTDLF